MKRIISLFLCTMLLLASLTIPALASEGKNYNVIFTIDSKAQKIASAVSMGDDIYVLLTDMAYNKAAIGRWTATTNQTEILTSDKLSYHGNSGWYEYIDTGEPTDEIVISRLFANGNEVYAFNDFSMDVRRLVDAHGNVAISDVLYSLDTGLLRDSYINRMFSQDDVLYLGASVNESQVIVRFDPASGDLLSAQEEPRMESFYPYQEGKLLALFFDPQNRYDQETGMAFPYELMIYDPVTRETVKVGDTVGEYNGGAVYRKDNNTVYFASGSELYSFSNMTPPYQKSGYLPITTVQYKPTMLAGTDLYVCLANNMLIVRQLDQVNENQVLKVAGSAYSTGHTAFVLNHPEIDILLTDDKVDTSFTDLATGMLTKDDMADVITLNSVRNPLDRIYSKGYAADLSGYPELVEMISKIDPAISASLMQDEKLYAVPTRVDGFGLGYVPETLELLGLTVEDLPKTYLEFFDFMANYPADYGNDHPDISLFNGLNSEVLLAVMNHYVYKQLMDGENIKFDTPLMRKLMAAYERIDFTEFDPYAKFGEDVWDNEESNAFYEKEALFTNTVFYGDPKAFDIRRDDKPLMLSLDDGIKPIADVQITVMIVNAKATNLDAAVLYLTESLKNCDESLSFAFYPDFNTPVPNPAYETNAAKLTADIEKVERAIESASAENKAEFEDTLLNLQGELKDNEERKMLFSEDEVAQFHEQITPYLYAAPLTPLTDWTGGAGENINSLVNQYRVRAIDMDTFIRELDKRMNMIRLEDQ